MLDATTNLRALEDERRYLEMVARLTIAGAVEVGPAPAGPVLAYAYASDDDDVFGR